MPPLTSINCDKIRRSVFAPFHNFLKERFPSLSRAKHSLYTHGLTAHVPNVGDHVQEFAPVTRLDMAVGRNARRPLWDTPNSGNLGVDLFRGQNAALAGLGPLRQLQLEHLYLRKRGQLAQLFLAQLSLSVAHAILRRADLHNHIAPALKVMRRAAALARRKPDARLGRPKAQRAHRWL